MKKMNFKDYLQAQAAVHPAMTPQDAVKMSYQAAFGPEHMLADPEGARAYFMEEYEAVPASDKEPVFENISEDICRVNLAAWKSRGLPAQWLFRIFAETAGLLHEKDKGVFLKNLEEAGEAAEEGLLPFSGEQWNLYKKAYMSGGIKAVHHSEDYRMAEKPAYRLADRRYMRLLPVLEKASCLAEDGSIKVIAIDGRAASGKTTMAGQLKTILGGEIIRMDDFFLPPELRTQERFSLPGSNVHHERFAEEVMPYLKKNETFSYRRFDCSIMSFDKNPVTLGDSLWRIVEGSYSHHPQLKKYAHVTVFSHVEPETQMERIVLRNGREMAEIFRKRWIPMEEEYFRTFSIEQNADVSV